MEETPFSRRKAARAMGLMGSSKWMSIWNLLTCRGEPRGRKSRGG